MEKDSFQEGGVGTPIEEHREYGVPLWEVLLHTPLRERMIPGRPPVSLLRFPYIKKVSLKISENMKKQVVRLTVGNWSEGFPTSSTFG